MTSKEIEECLKLLAATPRRITSASQGLDRTALHFKADEDTWSANDILAHLRACADVWGGSIGKMIAQDHPTLRYVSPRTRMRKTNYATLDFHVSLQVFIDQRKGLIKELRALTPTGWSRGATFTATTRGREQTVYSYARRIVEHEDEHCSELVAMRSRLQSNK